MEKKRSIHGESPCSLKLLKIMKLTVLLMLISLEGVFASQTYSQSTKLSLKVEKVSLEEFLIQIEDLSEFHFFYTGTIDVEKQVSGEFKNKRITEILDHIKNEAGIQYQVMGRQIVLSPLNSPDAIKSLQQDKIISGRVTDVSGEPLPGVTVVIKGTTQGTITDMDGNYSITVPDNATITFSFVGMKTQEMMVLGKTIINVVMEEESIGLEEVVAIGYGTVKKSDLTGAVGSINGDLVSTRQTTKISQALQGAMPGVMVTRTNNAPGSNATIRIRGITTIGNSEALVIIDGVPGSIDDVNPNDVENVSVLKDAASAAIYGSRAAAGVILITTKRAKTGQLSIDYNMEYGFEKPTVKPKFVDVIRYMEITNELRWNDNGNNSDEYPINSKDLIDNYYSLNVENPNLYPNTDWDNLILKNLSPRQSHVFSFTAGSKVIKTKASIAYDKTDGLIEDLTFERLTARLNNNVKVNKFLSATLDFHVQRAINKSLHGSPISNVWIMPPIYAATWTDGRIAEGKIGVNPYASYKYGGFNNTWSNQMGGKISIDITPLEGLKISAIASPNYNFYKNKNFSKKLPYYDWEDPTLLKGFIEGLTSTKLNESRTDSYDVTYQLIANYIKSFGTHNFNAMMGYENYYFFNEYLGASSDQLALSSYPYLDLGNANYLSSGGNAYETAYRSFFGRIMYNFSNKYFFQGNIRYDGSSRFHQDIRWGVFPSFSGGWVVSEENFMQNIPNVSFLKLRASWGTLGNERIGNYPYQSSIEFGSALSYQGNNIASVQTSAQTAYAMKNISWETTESFDIGFDLGFLKNSLRFSGDFYKKVTQDMLLELEIPDYIGFDNPEQNTGRMNTKGWEFELGWNDQFGEFGYSISANLFDFKSIMEDLGGIEFLGDQVKFDGSEFNEWYGYKSDGIFQTQQEVDNSATINSNSKPGDIKYTDISGPDGIPDGKISSEYDRILLGGSLPRYMYGGTFQLNYRNWDFSMVVQGVGKQKNRLTERMVAPLFGSFGNVPVFLDGNSWSMYNTEEQNLNAKYPRFSDTNKGSNYVMSDYWLISGAYFRVKNMTIGYNIPKALTEKLYMKSVKLYGSVSDFLTIDNYLKGWDPEVSQTGYPITASFLFGLSVKF